MAKKKSNKSDREAILKHLESRVETAKKSLAAVEDKSEGNPAAREARKRLKRAQRAVAKHNSYRGKTLARQAEIAAQKAKDAEASAPAPAAEAPAEEAAAE
ncbi:MAG: hypothetical protein KDH09_01835 [Chrysiogenetes bacterium]|nr:hypothetical protein [Chrysiogenetes bacterium]